MKPYLANPTALLKVTCGTALLTGLLTWSPTALGVTPPSATALGHFDQLLSTPERVATDAAGRVYIADSQAGQVVVVDGFGRLVSAKPGFAQPLAIAVDAQGNIYLAEAGRGRVTVFDPQWNPLAALGIGDGEFVLPGHIALDAGTSNLIVYVTDSGTNRVKAYENGVLVRTIGGPGSGPGQFNFPAGICVNPAGDLFVVDQNNDRVQVFDRTGLFLRAWSLRPPGITIRSGRSQGIANDGQGRVFVADTFQGYVKVFDESGVFLSLVGHLGRGVGQVLSPAGVALDGQGRLFVTSANSSRVEIYGLDCFQQCTAMPAAQVVAAGTNVTFSVAPSCAGPFTFQWRNGTNDLADGGTVAGATNATLTLTGVTAADEGIYTVAVTGPAGTAVSPAAILVVVSPPTITRNPLGRTAHERASTTFDVLTTGAALGYQWLFNGSPITGANASTLTLTNLQPSDAGAYSVIVSNAAGSAPSAAATLTVIEIPVIALQPASQTLPEWSTLTLAAEVVGSPTLTYQWYWKTSALSGRTSPSFSLTNANPSMNGNYYLVAANAAGRATSAVATVTVTPDTAAPRVIAAAGGYATNRTILVTFSKPVNANGAQFSRNYSLVGPGAPAIVSAVLSNGTNVTLNLSGPRTAQGNYVLQVQDILDTALTPNLLSPNPTAIPLSSTISLAGINSQPWKFLQISNAPPASWFQPTFTDTTWSNGFGIFYGNRTNSPWQPNPNPNVKLPLILTSSDPNNTKVYTILNVFTNAGNVTPEVAYYFRTEFDFPGETNGAALALRTMVDDGAVFYLNGKEAARLRMSAAPTVITYTSVATSSGSQSWEPAFTSAPGVLTSTALKPGRNVLAVEVHQNNTTGNDITLGLLLEASVARFTAAAPALAASASLSGLNFTWNDPFYLLESAPVLNGPWTTVSTTSPALVSPAQMQATPAQFFRLRRYL